MAFATLKFASWNVNNRKLREGHLSFLERVGCDILVLQEVSVGFHRALVESKLFGWSVSSIDLRPLHAGDGRSRRLGCSIFGRPLFELESACLLDGVAFPERTLVARLQSHGKRLCACSFHAPPGASWGEIKPQTLRTIAEWLAAQSGLIVFGIDANAPKLDHPDIEKNEWWWDDERLLLGAEPIHHLRDTFRLFLAAKPERKARLFAERPSGPLAVSYVRGHKQKAVHCRYDFVYVTPEVQVVEAEYLYDVSIAAGSDHALVAANLRFE